MAEVQLFERATPSFVASLGQRGHHIVYRANESNHCPGCGRSHWYIGRISAECGFCGTAIPLAEARRDEVISPAPRPTSVASADQRRHKRISTKGRELQLLIDGSPTSFALENISEGGAMGENAAELVAGAKVHVRFEGGILVPAVVKWAEDGLIGLAFDAPVMLDRSDSPAN
jgi:hypothetical protein